MIVMRVRTKILGIAALLLACGPLQAASVTDLLFDRDLMASIAAPIRIDYAYALQDHGGNSADQGPVHLEVRSVDATGKKEVYFDMFEGSARREFGPLAMSSQNPLLIVFLQRDVATMEKLTGGSQNYFRNRIRAAFSAPAEVESVQLPVASETVAGTRITMRPFADDPNIARFPQFKDKSYVFTVAPSLPGGIYQIATRTPDPRTGSMLLEESMTFVRSTEAR